MKILHFIETLGSGGAERLLVTLLPELARQGIEVELAVQHPPLELKVDLEALGIKVHILPKRRKWALFGASRDLSRLAHKQDVDVVHAHLYFPTIITAIACWFGMFQGASHATFHNLAYLGANKRTWKLALRRLLAGFLVRRGIDRPQAVSQVSADHYMQAYGLRNIIVIHNAIDFSLLSAVNALQGDALVLPGRMVPEKGHMDLIVALGQMSAPYPPVIFAGDGPLRQQLEEEIAKAGLPITVTGRLPYTKMLATIAAARLVIIPSRYEGFGLTALEALALGKPVIASTAGGLSEVMGNLGRSVPPGDHAALRQAINEALVDVDWIKSQKIMGPAHAAQFAVSTIAARQIALYQQTHSEKGSANGRSALHFLHRSDGSAGSKPSASVCSRSWKKRPSDDGTEF